MLRNFFLFFYLGATLALVACADPQSAGTTQKSSEAPFSINSCDDGVEACNGNERCISCLVEAGCADGPDPVWTGEACVCTDNNPSNCVYEFCCAQGFAWNPSACSCLPCGSKH